MKKMNARQMMLCMAGSVMCSVGVMGCYPLVPAYFAALYLERVSGPVLLGMMYIGMFVFMSTAAAVKYAVALVVVMGAIRLVEWANEGCPSYMAGSMAAIITMILSVAGGLLEWKDQPGILAAALEGAFILGAVIPCPAYDITLGKKGGGAGAAGWRKRGAADGVCGIVSGLVPGFSQYECRTSER